MEASCFLTVGGAINAWANAVLGTAVPGLGRLLVQSPSPVVITYTIELVITFQAPKEEASKYLRKEERP